MCNSNLPFCHLVAPKINEVHSSMLGFPFNCLYRDLPISVCILICCFPNLNRLLSHSACSTVACCMPLAMPFAHMSLLLLLLLSFLLLISVVPPIDTVTSSYSLGKTYIFFISFASIFAFSTVNIYVHIYLALVGLPYLA